MDSALVQAAIKDFIAKAGTSNASLELVVRLGVLVASADGTIDDAELGSLATILAEVFGEGMPPQLVRILVKDSAKRMESVDKTALAAEMGKALAEHGAVPEGLRVASAIARTSEGIADEERALVVAMADGAGQPGQATLALA
jgi:uncharacterized tellurite resistance protein B-like protein